MAQDHVDLIRRGLVAFNRHDVGALVPLCSPEIEIELVGVFAEPVRYAGPAGIVQYFRDQGEHWESFGFETREIRAVGDRVLLIGTQTARGRASGIELASPEAFVLAFDDSGLICSLRSFRDPAAALDALGLES
jgi:ketosteroid isomerase-like protein